jgi:hypothetical protein
VPLELRLRDQSSLASTPSRRSRNNELLNANRFLGLHCCCKNADFAMRKDNSFRKRGARVMLHLRCDEELTPLKRCHGRDLHPGLPRSRLYEWRRCNDYGYDLIVMKNLLISIHRRHVGDTACSTRAGSTASRIMSPTPNSKEQEQNPPLPRTEE